MSKHFIKESKNFTNLADIKDKTKKVKFDTSQGGLQMDKKEINIFEKEALLKKAEQIKESLSTGIKNTKKIILRGITLGAALSIIMSSVAFGGTHNVDNWESYKEAIMEDILKQDQEIIIYYEGNDKFETKDKLNQQVINMYNEAKNELLGRVEDKNVYKTHPKVSSHSADNEYSLNYGKYEMTYKNSAEDMAAVQDIIDNVLSQIITDNMSDYEKIKTVYQYVINAYHYGSFAQNNDDVENILKERNILLGLQGQGIVCEAYAMLFSKIISNLGYNNMIISGEITEGEDNLPVGNHAWNLVEINGQWYHVDPTWGDVDKEKLIEELKSDPKNEGVDEEIIREIVEEYAKEKENLYFLTSDSTLKENRHIWDGNKYPSAPEIYNADQQADEAVQQATEAVEKAEDSKSQADVDTARDLVNQLSDEEIKDSLNDRLNAIKIIGNSNSGSKDSNRNSDKTKNNKEQSNNIPKVEKGSSENKGKNEEEIKEENLKISKKKIEEIKTILKIVSNANVKIKVRNKEIEPDVKSYIYKEEKIFVPIRFIAEALGYEVNWSKPTWNEGIKKIYLSQQGKGIVMEIGKSLIYLNGKPIEMSFIPELKDGRTYVPIEFITEILENNFDYNNSNGTIEFNIK